MSHDSPVAPAQTKAQQWFLSWTTDVLIYVVVLNLFNEFSDAIVIEAFWISLLAAVVMKLLLSLVFKVEHGVAHVWERFEGGLAGVLRITSTLVVLVAGKFFILWGMEQVLPDVHLGHFVSVTVLILALLVAHFVLHWIYNSLGPDEMLDSYEREAPTAGHSGLH